MAHPLYIHYITLHYITLEHTLKCTWHLGRQMSHLSVQTKLAGFFKPTLLRSKTSTTSESSIDE
jgi:hypothetical protein